MKWSLMATATIVDIERLADVPKGTYALDGPTYALDGSKRLVKMRANFYDTVVAAVRITDPKMRASGRYLSPPSAGEEEAIYRKVSLGAKKLEDVEELKGYFGNNDSGFFLWRNPDTGLCLINGQKWYAWNWSTTCLRFDKNHMQKRYDIGYEIPVTVIETDITPFLSQIADPRFIRRNWKDIIGRVNKVIDQRTIQYARGQVIREMDPVLGIWRKIAGSDNHAEPFALHAWLRENLGLGEDLNKLRDPISGQYDFAVGRRGGWLHDEGCLFVVAHYGRWDAISRVGFRPVVRG